MKRGKMIILLLLTNCAVCFHLSAKDMHEICPRYARDMPKIFPRYAKDEPKICPRYDHL